MSYSVHITRKKNWFDPEGPIITKDEWLSIIQDDLELTLDISSGDACYADWSGECEKKRAAFFSL